MVPTKRGNRPEGPRGGKRGAGDTEPREGKTTEPLASDPVSTRLQRIAELAREDPKRAFRSLAQHIDVELLHEAFRRTRKDGAVGVDGQTGREYEDGLWDNLRSLLERFKSGRYKAPPVRRTYVPKGDGSERPIGIPTFEDKVLQRAVVMVMEAVYTVEARAAFIEATTASTVNHENATRCFELAMDESEEQTSRIHARQRLLRTERGLTLRQQAEAISRRHWNAQRLLEPLPVVIPFADRLTFPTAWMRTRRDHARFLNLIEVSAFLHQYQRERRGSAIVAALADYEAAYGLAGEVLADTLSDLKAPLKKALTRIQGLSEQGNGTVSRREIREALKEADSTVRGWLQTLVDLEYLALVEAGGKGAGKTARYRLADRQGERDVRLGLLTPEELRKKLR
jgi:hypothetical protein